VTLTIGADTASETDGHVLITEVEIASGGSEGTRVE
jgi:hypothetical protein